MNRFLLRPELEQMAAALEAACIAKSEDRVRQCLENSREWLLANATDIEIVCWFTYLKTSSESCPPELQALIVEERRFWYRRYRDVTRGATPVENTPFTG